MTDTDLMAKEIEAQRIKLDQHRWIPVSERLPKDGEVLVLCEGKIFQVKINVTEDDEDGKLTRCGIRHLGTILLGLDECITHWKPVILPERALKG